MRATALRARQEDVEFGDKSIGFDRLADVTIEAGQQQPFAVAHHRQRGHGQHRDVLQGRVAFEGIEHAVAIEPGQVDVADDQLRQRRARGRHAAGAVDRHQGCIAERRQQVHHQLHIGGVVFNNQDPY
jgi:hypothetical protein